MFGMGAMELVVIMAMLGGSGTLGLPLGMPPLPEDPVLAHAAPAECVWYWASSGTASPDAKSKNQTEQLLAEPEVQDAVRRAETLLIEAFKRSAPPSAEGQTVATELPKVVKAMLTRPAAVFVSKLEVGQGRPNVEAGLIVNLGDTAGEVDKLKQSLLNLERVASGGRAPAEIENGWRPLPLPADAPPAVWAVKGRYLILGIGEGAGAAIVKRVAARQTPEWLRELRERLSVERVSMISYLNAKKLVDTLTPLGGPTAPQAVEALGLDNVQWIGNVTGLDESGVRSRSLVATEGEQGGVLALAYSEPLTAESLRHIPRDALLAGAVRVDALELGHQLLTGIGKVDPNAQMRLQEQLGRFQADFGIDIQGDILEALGETWSVYSSAGDGGLLFTGLTAVVEVRDRQSLEKVLRLVQAIVPLVQHQEQIAGRRPRGVEIKQLKFAGETIHFVNSIGGGMPFAPAWCLTDDRLIVSLFPQHIKSHLARTQKSESLADIPEIQAVLKGKNPPQALMYQDTAEVFKLTYPMLQMFANLMFSDMQRQGGEVDVSILPSVGSIVPHLLPSVTTVARVDDGIQFDSHRSTPTGGGFSGATPVMVALVLPAVQSARTAARRAQSSNNLKQIGLAMHNHHDTFRGFPAPAITDKEKKPLLSWRVKILPFIEQQALFEQFRMDEPWDSEHNKQLIAQMPQIYASPASRLPRKEGKTNYALPRGEETIFAEEDQAASLAQITDGSSNTIMVVEVGDDQAVVWTQPEDWEFDPEEPMQGLGGLFPGGFNVLMADGSVRFISESIDFSVLKALFTRGGGEVVGHF